MSEFEEALNTGQQAIFKYDTSKVFVRENRYATAEITNGGLTDLEIKVGTLLGRVAATEKVTPLKSAAVDGSQFPVGISAQEITIAPSETAQITFCVSGDVVEDKIIFDGSDVLSTIVSLKTLRDRIGSDTVGIKIVPSTQMTDFDNE